ncbi:hypothetical protein M1O29_04010, partial [Dehalococcoidia bacterium]|nr:hypothetical protein [Dehalococcoidia bacterium]
MTGLTTTHTRKVTRALASFLREYGVWTGDDRPLMVAVSGGPDSVCLIHALAQLRGRLGVPLHACHFDHGIRGDESLDDARYVASLCKDLGVSLTSKDGDVPS